MPIITAVAIYFVIWWICLFMVLPFGVKGQHEVNEVIEGSEPGAPTNPKLGKKMLINSMLALIIWGVIMLLAKYHILTLDSLPFIPDFTPKEI